MADISAADVMKLRDRTGMQMMKCKAALTEAGGDMEKAVEILRKQNKDAQNKSADREAAEGRIAFFIDPDKQIGSLVEVRCETAPVGKTDQFMALANDLAKHIAYVNPKSVQEMLQQPLYGDPKHTVNDRIAEVIGLMREKMVIARFERFEGVTGAYIHHDGSVGSMVLVEGGKAEPQLLREVSMHITAKSPVAALREHVPQATIDKELEIAKAQAAATGKPANIVDKIAEGKMKTWYGENVLNEQPFVKDESKTVGDLLKAAGLKLKGFARFRVGEVKHT